MVLSQQINKVLPSAGGELVNYDYFDIAEGTGIKVFYGMKENHNGVAITRQTSGAYYMLSQTAVPSDSIVAYVQCTQPPLSGTFQKYQDLDFDIPFNLPKGIKGNAYVYCTQGINAVVPASSCTTFIQVRVRKWDGTTETELAVASGSKRTVNAVANASYPCSIKLNVPQTYFKKGETLRVTVEHWVADSGDTAPWVGFGIDPADRNDDNAFPVIDDTDTTKLEVHVPFLIQPS